MCRKKADILRVGSVIEKLAQFLLEMEAHRSIRAEIDLPMRRVHIADYLGVTQEAVSQALSALHKKKIIRFGDDRRIVIRDKPRLQKLAPDAFI
jgi:CRP-like cAMP-binding protein